MQQLVIIIHTPKANFSRKCETPLGYATSYLEPESITTIKENKNKIYH
jgi:hypothetical protein